MQMVPPVIIISTCRSCPSIVFPVAPGALLKTLGEATRNTLLAEMKQRDTVKARSVLAFIVVSHDL